MVEDWEDSFTLRLAYFANVDSPISLSSSTSVMLLLPQAKIEQLDAETNLDTLIRIELVAKNPRIKVICPSKFIRGLLQYNLGIISNPCFCNQKY